MCIQIWCELSNILDVRELTIKELLHWERSQFTSSLGGMERVPKSWLLISKKNTQRIILLNSSKALDYLFILYILQIC